MIFEVLPIAISIISLLLSIWTLFMQWFKSRKNLAIETILDDKRFNSYIIENTDQDGNLMVVLQTLFINKSQAPISINYIELVGQNKAYRCELTPSFQAHYFTKLIDTPEDMPYYHKIVESAEFPIRLDSLDAKWAHVRYKIPINANISNCFIYTNRGNKMKCPEILSAVNQLRNKSNSRNDESNN